MALWRKPLQLINVMLANRSPMSVAERGPGRMTYAEKKNPLQNTTCASRLSAQVKTLFAEHDQRVTLQRAGKKLCFYTSKLVLRSLTTRLGVQNLLFLHKMAGREKGPYPYIETIPNSVYETRMQGTMVVMCCCVQHSQATRVLQRKSFYR